MSMKPGATARPSASITLVASPLRFAPIAAMRPSRMARSPCLPSAAGAVEQQAAADQDVIGHGASAYQTRGIGTSRLARCRGVAGESAGETRDVVSAELCDERSDDADGLPGAEVEQEIAPRVLRPRRDLRLSPSAASTLPASVGTMLHATTAEGARARARCASRPRRARGSDLSAVQGAASCRYALARTQIARVSAAARRNSSASWCARSCATRCVDLRRQRALAFARLAAARARGPRRPAR